MHLEDYRLFDTKVFRDVVHDYIHVEYKKCRNQGTFYVWGEGLTKKLKKGLAFSSHL